MSAFDLELSQQADFVRRLAARLARDPAGADDLTQDTLTAALGVRSRPPRELRPWLAKVLMRRAADHETSRVRRADATHAHASSAERASSSAQEAAAQVELGKRLMQHVDALDEPLRTAVHLRYFDGLMPREIAERLGVSVGTVKSRLYRALDRLRLALDGDSERGRESWFGVAAMLGSPAERTRDAASFTPMLAIAAAACGVAATAFLVGGSGASNHSATFERTATVPPATTALAPVAIARRTALATANEVVVRGTVHDATEVGADAPLVAAAGVEVHVEVRAAGDGDSSGASPTGSPTLAIARAGDRAPAVVHRAVTEADGSFELTLREGTDVRSVRVASTDHLRARRVGPVDPTAPIALVRRPIGALSGIVVDLDEVALAGVRVTGVRWVDGTEFRDAAISDVEGRFTLAQGFDAGWFEVEHPGSIWVEYTSPKPLEFGGFEPARIEVARTGTLDLTFVDEHGAPVDPRSVRIYAAWPGPGSNSTFRQPHNRYLGSVRPSDGRATVEVPAGVELAIGVRATSFLRREGELALGRSTSNFGRPIQVVEGGTLALRVPVHDGLVDEEHDWPTIDASSQGDAIVRIRAQLPSGADAELRTTLARPNATVPTEVPMLASGTLLHADPSRGALPYAKAPSGTLDGIDAEFAAVESSSGTIQEFRIEPGVVWIGTRVRTQVDSFGGAYAVETAPRSTGWVRIEPGVTEIDLQVTPTSHVDGMVRGADDFEPCVAIVDESGAPLRLLAEGWNSRTIFETASRGEFVIGPLGHGEYDVWVGTYDELEAGTPRRIFRRATSNDAATSWSLDL